MSRREDIDNGIWTKPEFERLSADATLLYLWSFTNLRCGMAGVYEVSHRGMSESKVPEERIPATLEELTQAGFVSYEDDVLFVRTRVKYLRSKSPQMAQAIANDVAKLPPGHVQRARFFAEYGTASWLQERLRTTCSEPIGNLSEKPVGKPDPDNPSGPSLEGPMDLGSGILGSGLSGTGNGEGLPDGFPENLEPHLDAAHRALTALAERHGSRAVSRLSLASIIVARPHKPLVRAAHDFAAWADGKAQRRKDVVAGYRNWLDRTDDLAGVEAIGGTPAGGNVVALARPDVLQRADGFKRYYDNGESA